MICFQTYNLVYKAIWRLTHTFRLWGVGLGLSTYKSLADLTQRYNKSHAFLFHTIDLKWKICRFISLKREGRNLHIDALVTSG